MANSNELLTAQTTTTTTRASDATKPQSLLCANCNHYCAQNNHQLLCDISKIEYFSLRLSVDSIGDEITVWQRVVGDVGCVVWDAALMLCKYLDHNCDRLPLRDANVIELGSGTGICGIMCAALGANVIATDLDSCVPLIITNVVCNKRLTGDRVVVNEWKWENNSCAKFFHWNLSEINYVLVSDCIYYEESVKQLYDSVVWLSSNGAIVLLTYEEREDKQHLIERFFHLLRSNSDMKFVKVTDSELNPEYCSPDLHLYRINYSSF